MGCDESQEENPNKPIIASEVFAELELQKLMTPEATKSFENNFEKDIFMAINVLRAETAVFESVVKAVRENNPLVKNAKHTDKLIKFLEMNERLGEIVGAAIYPKSGAKICINELQSFLSNHLASFKVPSKVFITENALPRLGSGKLNKKQMKIDFYC